ncbi:MAG TPA: glutathione S-transferase family protein [Anaeromyxobacteraceae bacterium]|jgi:glutathione S-transferase|nr:glutathione S-transferase family protein [Anaeromyxobacteraceae bacterium]
MSKPTLIYFAGRGRAELIRLVLAEAGVDYQEHVVGKGTPPVEGRPTDFAELKATGTLPFDALPVWEEPGGLRLAQSGAIANHIARAHGLRGRNAVEEARCDELLGAVDDVRLELRKLATVAAEQRPALRAELASATLPRWLGYLDRLLRRNGEGAGYAVGASVTVADLALWYLLELLHDNGLGGALERCPALVAFAERIGSRPRIAAYLKSARRPAFVPLPT